MPVKFNETPGRRVTQQEIAKIAGVSHVAVSYALHRKLQKRISEEKQEEIRRIAHALGYQPRAMTTYTIGLAMPVRDISLEITTSIVQAADAALRSRGYRLTLAAYDDKNFAQGLLLDEKNADGVILTDPITDVSKIISPRLPRVLLADSDEQHLPGGLDQVSFDSFATMNNVVAYAAQKGHRQIAIVVSADRCIYDDHLREGFRAALKTAGIPQKCGTVIEVGETRKTAEQVIESLSSPNAPTLIIAGSAARALNVVNALQWARYRVPEDVSVISFVDSERLPHLHPAVTATTALDQDLVSLAIERLLQKIEEPDSPAQRVLVPGTVIERESVKPLGS